MRKSCNRNNDSSWLSSDVKNYKSSLLFDIIDINNRNSNDFLKTIIYDMKKYYGKLIIEKKILLEYYQLRKIHLRQCGI